MWLIDFILTQIVDLIMEPRLLTLNQHHRSLISKETGTLPKRVLGDLAEMVHSFMNPTFNDIQINVRNVTGIFRAWPQHKEFFQARIEGMRLSNAQFRTKERFTTGTSPIKSVEELWIDRYILKSG